MAPIDGYLLKANQRGRRRTAMVWAWRPTTVIRFPTERFDHNCPEIGMGTLFMIKAISRKAYHTTNVVQACRA
jgi:hypothetical protein